MSYIGTRTNENVPNYSLLLGAGASVTSGIKTGVDLVSMWRKEIYEKYIPDDSEYNEQKAKNYLIKEHSNWYSLSNEYSALFEHKFDLPSQRRRFVEREVDGHLPSIGYSYLVSLATNRYFDTIYTTNFDDLLNEAFYQFSQVRPIVCAHDSSLQSISVNSARPKIIKLHGDYLFDDIKSTLRETESLESNIKNKLSQFSKEYGLIVMGYAGNDRSVMDVINFLLKSDEHLKNGVYWCLRDGDYINPELTKLLWKDKVYFINIGGFDEVMAEIHHELKGELSLDENFTNSKKEAILSSFTKDKWKLSQNSEFINSDIEHLTKHKNSMDISNLIRELNEKEFNGSEDDFKTLLSIDRLVQEKNYAEAINIIKNRIQHFDSKKSKEIYLKRLISIYKKQHQNEDALKLCDELISLDPYQVSNVILKAETYIDLTERCEFIQANQTNFEYSYHFYNYLLSNAIKEIEFAKKGSVFEVDYLLSLAEKSRKLEPSLDNIAWTFSLDLLEIKFTNSSKKEKSEGLELAKNIVELAENINPKHTRTLKMGLHPFLIEKDYARVKLGLSGVLNVHESSSKKKRGNLLKLVCDKYPSLSLHKNNCSFHADWTEFMESDIVQSVAKNDEPISLLICKAKYYIRVERDKHQALTIVKRAMLHADSFEYVDTIIDYFLAFSSDYESADIFLEKVSEDIHKFRYHYVKSNILAEKLLYDDAIEHLQKSYTNGLSFVNYISRLTYLNLKAERYTKVINIVDTNIGFFIEQSDKDVLIINKELAHKKLNGKLSDKVTIRNVISRGITDHLIIAAECLLENDIAIKRLLKQIIDKDYFDLYHLSTWPVIPSKYFQVHFSKENKDCVIDSVKSA